MFFGKNERDLVKQVNDELAERVLGQTIAYYPISMEESNFNDTYGEAVEKVSLPPVRVFAFVQVENEQTNEKYGYDYQSKLTVNFHRRRLVEDQDLYVRIGDFIQYGEFFYEIVRTYNDTRYYFGQVEHKFQISAECVRARQGTFRVMPGIDRPADEAEAEESPQSPAPRPAPYPPLAASYITVNSETKLPNERRLKAGAGISITDGGPNGNLTIASSGQNAVGPTGSIQVNVGDGTFYGDSTFLYNTASNTLTITGHITASTHMSSSAFYGTSLTSSYINLLPNSGSVAGAGSYLALDSDNNIIITASVGTGQATGQGPVGSLQFQSGSGQISGSGNILFLTASNTLQVLGNISSSVSMSTTALSSSLINLFPTSGTLAGLGSYLALDADNNIVITSSVGSGQATGQGPVGSLQFQSGSGEISGSGNILFLTSSNTLQVLGDITASVNISASSFYGDGSNLTNVTASAVEVADGPEYSLQFRRDDPITGEISGSANLIFTSDNLLALTGTFDVTGDITSSANVSASAFFGDGSNLTGILNAAGNTTEIQFNNAGDFSASPNLTYNTSTDYLAITGSMIVSGGLVHKRVAIATSYTASATDYFLAVTAVPTSILFDATSFSEGQTVIVKDESGAASLSNKITINPSGSQTVDGIASLTVASPYGSVLLYSNGSNWFIY